MLSKLPKKSQNVVVVVDVVRVIGVVTAGVGVGVVVVRTVIAVTVDDP